MNTWHSFQYLAITFYIIKIRQIAGDLDDKAPLVARFSRRTKDARALYGFSAFLLVGSAVIFLLVYTLAGIVKPGIDGNSHFDIAYYTAILSFLWIHSTTTIFSSRTLKRSMAHTPPERSATSYGKVSCHPLHRVDIDAVQPDFQCKCGPVLRPVEPIVPMTCPLITVSPTDTSVSC